MKIKLLVSCLILIITTTSMAQKPKKTHNHEAFVKKVKMAFVPDYIGRYMPNDVALNYMAEKSGRPISELKAENGVNLENVKKNLQYLLDNNIAFVVDKTELNVTQETPYKIADIIIHCSFRDNNFKIKMSDCVQTNISWYVGTEIVPEGDGFEGFVAYNDNKKPSGFMEKLKEIDDNQNEKRADNEKLKAYADSMRELRPGYEAVIFPMKGVDKVTKYYNSELTNMPLEGYYILNNGSIVQSVIAYQKPEFLVGDLASASSLFICNEANNKVLDVLNPDHESNFKEFIAKDKIKAFYVGGQLYSNIANEGWRIVLNEGAIHSFVNIVKTEKYVAFEQTQKLEEQALGSFISPASTNVKLDMMEDCPDLVQEYKEGKITMFEAEIKYNIWHDLQYPEKISYLPIPQ